ncbi:MAG: hypothetical protein J6L69_11200 [Lachnospiraceae bacterium]|nr:hypothetical protein [Lachnospiraceae bacterium]
MAFFFGGVTTDSVGTLFSSLGSKNSTTSMLSDYYSIKNGSYKKLLTAYYAMDDDKSDKTASTDKSDTLSKLLNKNKSTSTAKDSSEVLVGIEEAANGLKEAANTLLDKKKTDSVYNTDNLYNNVKAFVDSYNGVIDAAKDTNTNSISKNLDSMINQTNVNKKMLANIGIEIGEDNKLSVNKDKLASADVETVKSMLGSVGSYGYRVSASASMINFNAQYEASRANTYTANGTYSNNYSTGGLYDTLF